MKRNRILITALIMVCLSSYGIAVAADTKFGSRWIGGSMVIYPPDHPGNAYLVDNEHDNADDDNPGLTWDAPCATIRGALAKCTADADDKVYVRSRHDESLGNVGSITGGTSGVKVIGLGEDDNRPLIKVCIANAASITADDVTFENLRWLGYVDGIANAIGSSGDNTKFIDCEFADNAASNTLIWLNVPATPTANGCVAEKCVVKGTTTAGNSHWVKIWGGADHRINNNLVLGDFSTAAIQASYTNADNSIVDMQIKGNTITNTNAVDVCFSGSDIGTGWIENNHLTILTNAQVSWVTTQGSMTMFENYGADRLSGSGTGI